MGAALLAAAVRPAGRVLLPCHDLKESKVDPQTARRGPAVWALMALLVIQGLGGLAGGASLVAGPHGEIMHMPVSYLNGSPFPDFTIPGLALGLILGVWPLVTLLGMRRGTSWAWYSSFAIGCGLVIFETVEVLIIPYNILQPIFYVVGFLIAALTLLPPVRRHCGVVLRRVPA